ncbi:MAG: thioesterase family protein [Verrucomicrobiota bacterium]
MAYQRQVGFAETDASGRAHFTSVLKWVEEAEHVFLRERGIVVFDGELGWPRARVECDYRSAVMAGDEVVVEIGVAEVGESSVQWRFRVLRTGGVVAEGWVVTVFAGEKGSLPLSDEVREVLLRDANGD